MTRSSTRLEPEAPKSNRKQLILFTVVAVLLMSGAAIYHVAKEVISPTWREEFHKGMGFLYVDHAKAEKIFDSAVDMLEKGNEEKWVRAVHIEHIGAWCLNNDKPEYCFSLAKKYFLKAYELTDKPLWKATCDYQIANCDYYSGVVGDGEQRCEEALTIRRGESKVNEDWIWEITDTLGRCALLAGHHPRAEVAFTQAFDLAEKLHEPVQAGRSLLGMARAYAMEGKRKEADTAFVECIRRFDEVEGPGSTDAEVSIADYARTLKKAGYQKAYTSLAAKLDTQEMLHFNGPLGKADVGDDG